MSHRFLQPINTSVTYKARIPELLALEGWYKLTSPLWELYNKDSTHNKPKFSKWLMKNGITDQKMVKKIVESSNVRFKLSCRFNDIKRCSITDHFDSCFRPSGIYDNMPETYLEKFPQIAIVYVPDGAGFMIGRFWIIYQNGKLIPGRVYGDIPAYAMMQEICDVSGLRPGALPDENFPTYIDYGENYWYNFTETFERSK